MLRKLLVAAPVALLLAGCVSQAKYDRDMEKARLDLGSARSQVETLAGDLRDAQAKNQDLGAKLAEAAKKVAEAGEAAKPGEGLGLAEELKGVPGASFDKKGAAEVTISFGSGGTDLQPEAAQAVKKVGEALAKEKGLVFVDGHSDNVQVANPETKKMYVDNLGLSLARAAAVARVLEDSGVAADRIIVRGFGSLYPTASNDDAEGRAKNRRVEIYYTPSAPVEKAEAKPAVQPAPEAPAPPAAPAAPAEPKEAAPAPEKTQP